MPGPKNVKKVTLFSVITLLIISILIKAASNYPLWIERNYSRGIYLYIANIYRTIFGWIPFSIGDILYAVTGVALFFLVIKIVKVLLKGQFRQVNLKGILAKFALFLLIIYVYFNIAWGLNYNRPGIAYQLQLNAQMHTEQELKEITTLLLNKVNENRQLLGAQKISYKPYEEVFDEAVVAYQRSASTFPFMEYSAKSVKRSMYGRMGNFLGFLGYYNPFSGEAQVNLTQPRFLIPYVSCHEMAHQLGYASESEANFVGYLAAVQSPDTLFHYSAYFDLFNYANHELFLRDSVAAKDNVKHLTPLVKADLLELQDYWEKSQNPIEPIIKIFYDHYLKANQQEKGVKSYNEVIGWLISYYKKYGKI
jgi:hypothetical protein